MPRKFEIMFDNFTKETQDALLRFYDIAEPDEMNWETFPIVTIEIEDNDDTQG